MSSKALRCGTISRSQLCLWLRTWYVTCSDFQAYMQEKDDDKPVHVFGKGNIPMLKGLFGIKNSFEIPLRSHIAKYSDAGAPVVLSLPKSERIPQIFSDIAANLDKECYRLEK